MSLLMVIRLAFNLLHQVCLRDQFSDHCCLSFTLMELSPSLSLTVLLLHLQMIWFCTGRYAPRMTIYRFLQRDVEAVARWTQRLNLQFNTNKCKFMVLSRRRSSIEPPAIIYWVVSQLNVSHSSSILVYTSLLTFHGPYMLEKFVQRAED